VFYSDGITEAENVNQEEYGLARLAKHSVRPGSSAVSILDDVRSFSNGANLRDDASVVFVGVGR
jgi:serine phosphatase RsbU (regulator of sigma subunit)